MLIQYWIRAFIWMKRVSARLTSERKSDDDFHFIWLTAMKCLHPKTHNQYVVVSILLWHLCTILCRKLVRARWIKHCYNKLYLAHCEHDLVVVVFFFICSEVEKRKANIKYNFIVKYSKTQCFHHKSPCEIWATKNVDFRCYFPIHAWSVIEVTYHYIPRFLR